VNEGQTTPREWALAVAGGVALAAVLVWWWRGPEQVPVPEVEFTAAPPPVAAPVPVAPAVDMSGFVLRGILTGADGGSAIIEAGGRQRLVRKGGVVVPGVRLEGVESGQIRLVSGANEQVLVLDSARLGPVSDQIEPVLATEATLQSLSASANAYRLALLAVRGADGQISGWRLRDVAQVPLFRMAGMQAGDVLLAVNDQPLSSTEKVMELPLEVASAYAVKLRFSRGGQVSEAEIALKR
jgi:type II secretory pathway component PulC